jgi:hypothetical protein
MGPEDREGYIEIKRISKDSVLGSHPSLALGWLSAIILKRSWSLGFKWKKPSRAHGWCDVE